MIRHQRAVQALVLLFLLSGAVCLVYETLWVRQLRLILGAGQLAVATVLAAFMAGLALGGLAAARWAGRAPRPLVAYAVLEGFIGAYALGFPWLLELATSLYLAWYRALAPGPALAAVLQFGLLGGLLLPPAAAMGATLPLAARFAAGLWSSAGREVGRLYGANTLGATLGAALAGFVLLPRLGVAATNWLAVGLSGLLALAAGALAAASRPLPPTAPVPLALRSQPPAQMPALLVVAGLCGGAALLCEVAWTRLLTLILGGSAYAFSIMLLAFLLGIGLGGWAGGVAADRGLATGGRVRVLSHLAGLQMLLALFCWGAMFLYAELPLTFVWLYDRLAAQHPWLLWPSQALLALAVMLPPALIMGASFPYLVRAAAGPPAALSRPVGLIYGVNTLGALTGAALGGLWLLPALHIRGTVLAAALVNLAAALIAAFCLLAAARGLRVRGLALGLGSLLLAGLLLLLRPPWDPLLMTAGLYRYVGLLSDRSREGALAYAVRPFRLLFYEEGRSAVITVGRNGLTKNLWLATNGKVDASSQADLKTQLLLGHLPMLFRPQARRVLVIGLGSGITVGAVTLHPEPESIAVAEIEPAAVAASRLFADYNRRYFDDPRVRLHLNDARHHLLLCPDGAFDLISSEPSNPWLSGVSNLFTAEFFALGRRKLAPGGLWAQWLHTYAMTPRDLRSLLATFAQTFAFARLFRVNESDLIILGSDAPLPLSERALARELRRLPAMAGELSTVGVLRAADLLGLYQMDRPRLLALGQGLPRNTDDNLLVEYSAPLHLYQETSPDNARLLLGAAEIPVSAVEGVAGLKRLATAFALSDWDMRRALATIEIAARRAPHDPDIEVLRQAYQRQDRQPPGGGASPKAR